MDEERDRPFHCEGRRRYLGDDPSWEPWKDIRRDTHDGLNPHSNHAPHEEEDKDGEYKTVYIFKENSISEVTLYVPNNITVDDIDLLVGATVELVGT